MAKAAQKILVIGPLVASHCYLTHPDDKAPEGASFTPDGKYKTSGIADDVETFAQAEAVIREEAEAKFPGKIDWDTFNWPFKVVDEDDRREELRGKVVVTAKSKFQPKCVGKGGVELPKSVSIYSGDVIKIAVTTYLYEKTETVIENKKKKNITIHGCSLQLSQVKLVEKRSGGGGGDPFGDDDDGYEVPADYEHGEDDPDVSGDF